MTVRIALAFSNDILRESIRVLLCEDPDLKVVGSAAGSVGAEGISRAAGSGAEVMVVDYPVLNLMNRMDVEGMPSLVLVDTGCGTATLAGAVLKSGVRGVLGGGSTPVLLRKCVRAVAAGELWLDQENMQTLISSLQEMGDPGKVREEELSRRERQVAMLAGRGHSNREIAGRLFISEQTVKAHLSSVYRKLDISSRSQLVTSAARKRARGVSSATGVA